MLPSPCRDVDVANGSAALLPSVERSNTYTFSSTMGDGVALTWAAASILVVLLILLLLLVVVVVGLVVGADFLGSDTFTAGFEVAALAAVVVVVLTGAVAIPIIGEAWLPSPLPLSSSSRWSGRCVRVGSS